MAEPDNFLSRWSRRKLDARDAPRVAPEPANPAPAAVPPPQPEGVPMAQPAHEHAADSKAAQAEDPPHRETAAASAPPTLDDVALLDRDSIYARFVARDVSPDVRNAALKKLFSDPHYNVMDGLDIYIDDYGKPDPLPAGMLRQMVQSKVLGLFAAEDAADAEAARVAAIDSDADGRAPTPADTAAEPSADVTLPAAQEDLADAAAAPSADTTACPTTERPAPACHEDTDLQLQPVDGAGCADPQAGTGQDPGRQRGRAG